MKIRGQPSLIKRRFIPDYDTIPIPLLKFFR
jgi:hypothetical protein